MAKIKFNVKGVDSRSTGSLPKPGLYTCKVIACVDNKPDGKDRRLEVQYEIQDKENKGFRLYDYINLESEAARWKLKQFLEAMGVDKDSGTFDTDDFIGTALTVKVKIQPETEQFPASARPQQLMPLDGEEEDLSDEEDLSEEDDEDEAEDDDAEDDESDEDEDEDEDDEDSDDEDEAYTAEDLAELDKDDLMEIAEEVGVDFPDGKFGSAKKRKLIADILAAQAGDEEEDEEDEDDEEEAPDYEAMDLKALKALAKERGLKSTGTAKVLVARLKKSDSPF